MEKKEINSRESKKEIKRDLKIEQEIRSVQQKYEDIIKSEVNKKNQTQEEKLNNSYEYSEEAEKLIKIKGKKNFNIKIEKIQDEVFVDLTIKKDGEEKDMNELLGIDVKWLPGESYEAIKAIDKNVIRFDRETLNNPVGLAVLLHEIGHLKMKNQEIDNHLRYKGFLQGMTNIFQQKINISYKEFQEIEKKFKEGGKHHKSIVDFLQETPEETKKVRKILNIPIFEKEKEKDFQKFMMHIFKIKLNRQAFYALGKEGDILWANEKNKNFIKECEKHLIQEERDASQCALEMLDELNKKGYEVYQNFSRKMIEEILHLYLLSYEKEKRVEKIKETGDKSWLYEPKSLESFYQ